MAPRGTRMRRAWPGLHGRAARRASIMTAKSGLARARRGPGSMSQSADSQIHQEAERPEEARQQQRRGQQPVRQSALPGVAILPAADKQVEGKEMDPADH